MHSGIRQSTFIDSTEIFKLNFYVLFANHRSPNFDICLKPDGKKFLREEETL